MTRRTAKNPLTARGNVVKETGDAGASNTDAALEHSVPDKEVRHMSRCGHYPDSVVFFKTCEAYKPSRSIQPIGFEPIIHAHDARVAMGWQSWPPQKDVRLAIYRRDNNRCYYCGGTDNMSLDHKVPRCVGGSNHSGNLVTACKSCNSAKGVKTIPAFVDHRFGGGAA